MAFDARNVAEAFPPGDFIKEELEARGWRQEDLAEIMGRAPAIISNLINGKQSISLEIASDLAAVFGTTAQLWLNLESAYRLFLGDPVNDTITRKARLFEIAPVKDIIRRGWIQPSKEIDVLEERVFAFLGIISSGEKPKPVFAAKSATTIQNPVQIAWVSRAMGIAPAVQAAKFSEKSFDNALVRLATLQANPEDIRHVPRVLAEGGVRLLVIESLPKGAIDGACFWLDGSSPVIAMSMRYDRIDHFWYILLHECGHIYNRDALNDDPLIDLDLVGDKAVPLSEKSENEKNADLFAVEHLVEKREMENFITRTRPLYSKQKIKNFAARIKVHPAIVLGQLQHRGEVEWNHSREMLVKVRDILTSSALTDGWGHQLPTTP